MTAVCRLWVGCRTYRTAVLLASPTYGRTPYHYAFNSHGLALSPNQGGGRLTPRHYKNTPVDNKGEVLMAARAVNTGEARQDSCGNYRFSLS